MVVPPFPPSPYVDAPGYIMPHTQLHLVDYRRMMNPHMAPTVAYQARRFRYQHANTRVMISSEVQTEPTLGQGQMPIHSTANGVSNGPTSSESGIGRHYTSASTSTTTSTSSASSTEMKTPERLEPVVKAMSRQQTSSTFVDSATPRTTVIQDHILFQTEEVQVKHSGTVVDLKIAHCEETAKLVSDFNSGLLDCSTVPPYLVDGALQKRLPSPQPEELMEGDEERSAPAEIAAAYPEEPCLPSCPDILLTGASSTGTNESLPPTEETSSEDALNADAIDTAMTDQAKNVIADLSSSVVACGDSQMVSKDDLNVDDHDLLPNSSNPQFKILHLGERDLQFGEVQHLETSVWSVESLMPYVPNTEWLMQNGLMTPKKSQEVPLSPVIEDPMSPTQTADFYSLQERQAIIGVEPDSHDSMTSLESLPTYLPSASWLADFGNVYLYHKFQPNVRQRLSIYGNLPLDEPSQDVKGGQPVSQSSGAPPSRRREESSGHKRRTGAPSDVSDHESQAMSSQGGGHLSPHQGHCVCNHSLTKRSAAPSSPTPSMKRHKLPHPQRDAAKSSSFPSCKCVPGRAKSPIKGSGSDVPGRLNEEDDTTEGETSENSIFSVTGSKRANGGQKRASESRKTHHLSRHSEKCPGAQRPKLREQNCSCDEPKSTHSFSGPRDGTGHNQHNAFGWRRGEVDSVMAGTERHRVAQKGCVQKYQAGKITAISTFNKCLIPG